ncbi:type I secretion system permease/ATPase [Marinobacterium sediminicola]|uniref:ATP-binding cassette, subfamily C, LapB n=1 Tax=Marinobacterium sediminicola TaxID=518898 RepID=A0ABY1RY06_9GAMM|nr:type I secretion system permease/ATPase [Marinobacterium sediminicola]ULG68592.1 type I secretion system permease/ATPase [Marinobacterium sediminicola]SMR73110.1 ATP-binding cassette, subfamily C, LapB [Marinobacterium sediminicola]
MDVEKDPLLQCLVLLTEQNNRPRSPQVLTEGLPLVDGRLTPKLFLRAAARGGFAAKLAQRPLGELSNLLLPAVLLLEGEKACILQRLDFDKGEADVLQPESGGVAHLNLDELEQAYTGHVLFMRPEYQFGDTNSSELNDRSGHWFWSTLWRSARIYRDVLLASVLINLFVLANPLFVMNVYDRVVPNHAVETLWVLAIGVLVVYLFDFGLKMLRSYFIEVAGKKSDVLLSARLFEKVMGLRYDAMPSSVGAFASNLREFESIRNFLSSTTNTVLIDIPFMLLFLVVISWIGGPLVLVPALAIPMILIYALAIRPSLRRSIERTFSSTAQKNGTLVESLTAMETLKTQRAASPMQARWEEAVGYIARWGLRSRMLSSSVVSFAGLVQQLASVLLVIGGVYMIMEQNLSMGGLIACVILSGRAIAPLGQVASLVANYEQSLKALKTLDEIMALPDEHEPDRRYLHRPDLKGGIEFKEVDFTYPGTDYGALKGISFRLQPGEKVALIGRIGSGKSSIQKLLLGLYKPSRGAIAVDGIDLNQIDPSDLRRSVGYVPQDVMLFAGSVRDNITIGLPKASDEQILQAARLSGVESFVNQHPLGFDMPVGERGSALSGGQRQAVALARALLHDPSTLILDEPSNSMDNASEDYLRRQLKDYAEHKTVLMVTHKMSLLDLVDRLIVIDGGKVVADGPKDSVLEALKQGRLQVRR